MKPFVTNKNTIYSSLYIKIEYQEIVLKHEKVQVTLRGHISYSLYHNNTNSVNSL